MPPVIDLVEAAFVGPKGQGVAPGEKLSLQGGTTTVELLPTKLSTASVSLMKSVLPFDRMDPGALEIRDLRHWHPGLGMKLKTIAEGQKEMVVGGITRLTFVSDKVKGSFQRDYQGGRGRALISGVRLQDEATALALWEEIQKVESTMKVGLSVKSGLGHGRHWFFRRRNRYCMLWQRGSWFFSVETRLAVAQSSAYQQRQFSDQVLRSLRAQLMNVTSPEEGVQR